MIGRIYKITSINTDKIYIGSTTKSLTARLRRHEIDYKAFQNGKQHFIKSYDILEKENYDIELLEEIEYDAKTELFKREGYYIRKHRDICVNKCIAGRTDKQYRTDNADKKRQYYKDNMVKIKEQQSEKFECVCGKTYTRHNKVRHDKTKIHIKYVSVNRLTE